MSIYLTGDVHATNFYSRISPYNLTEEDYLIICGDFGINWDISDFSQAYYDWCRSFPFTILYVDGNHENFDILNQQPVGKWRGGLVHQLAPNIFHLMRGQHYTVEDKTFFTFGGADSIDKAYRTEFVSWWRDEMPTFKECEEGLNSLLDHHSEVDYILTHAAPTSILPLMNERFKSDVLTEYLEIIKRTTQFKHWYFGHYHLDKELNEKFTVLYNNVIKL